MRYRQGDIVNQVTIFDVGSDRLANCGVTHRSKRDLSVILVSMSVKYYTQFKLTDGDYHGGNEFSGVVELSHPMEMDSDVTDIEAILAKNFDLQRSAVQLVSWSRLH